MENGKWKIERQNTNAPDSFSIFHLSFSICHSVSVLNQACFGGDDHLVDCLHLRDELFEHIGQQRLWTIRQGLFGMVMNFDHYPVGARRDRRSRERNNLMTLACSVRRIDRSEE